MPKKNISKTPTKNNKSSRIQKKEYTNNNQIPKNKLTIDKASLTKQYYSKSIEKNKKK
jgi:hypothetical protein